MKIKQKFVCRIIQGKDKENKPNKNAVWNLDNHKICAGNYQLHETSLVKKCNQMFRL